MSYPSLSFNQKLASYDLYPSNYFSKCLKVCVEQQIKCKKNK